MTFTYLRGVVVLPKADVIRLMLTDTGGLSVMVTVVQVQLEPQPGRVRALYYP